MKKMPKIALGAWAWGGDNKELFIVPGANHTDLYDQIDIIPFDKLNNFFTKNLK